MWSQQLLAGRTCPAISWQDALQDAPPGRLRRVATCNLCSANGLGIEKHPRSGAQELELSCLGACMLACVLYNLLHSSSKSKAASARIEAGRILSGIRSTTLSSCLGPPTAGLTKDLFGWVSISCGIESSTLSSVFVVIHPPGEDNFPFFRSHRNLGRGGQTPKRAVNDWAVHRCDILNDD